MASSRRLQSLTVVQQLLKHPYKFDFFQAVRLLERGAQLNEGAQRFALESVASQAMPNREVLRFTASQNFAFSAAPIAKIAINEIIGNGDSDAPELQWAMEVSFMGLTGSQGVMPHFLSDIVLRELRQKNFSLRDFLDIFNHRSVSFYYRAWQKYQLPVNVEQNRQRQSRSLDAFTNALCALSGVALGEAVYRTPLPIDAMAGIAGLLGRPVSTAEGLKGTIKHHFGLTVDIEQFQGQWQELPEEFLCRLPGPDYPNGVNNCLGINTVLGTSCHHAQSKFRVVVEPMNYDDFESIAPGSKKLEALKSFIKFSAGAELDFDISVTLDSDKINSAQLIDDPSYCPQLGWNTHMSLETIEGGEPFEIILAQDIDAPDESLPQAS
ncbi:MAG: type VI secretion system baseplate subunit TssG [Cellvibrionaceae bacterium]|nr:type VI secretion system baseplate subunit TssG [Cellvibrionaceae bacterium]